MANTRESTAKERLVFTVLDKPAPQQHSPEGKEALALDVIAALTSKDDPYACTIAENIVSESQSSDTWYAYFDDFASLLKHPKSLVRNRALSILAANIRWDDENRFDLILPEYLSHITDEKPITSRQCIKALAQIGRTKPVYISRILAALRRADCSKYRDSMRPLIQKDIAQTESILFELRNGKQIKVEAK